MSVSREEAMPMGARKGVPKVEPKTAEERDAVDSAIEYAEESNAGSTFAVTDLELEDGWARVSLTESGVPEEEAIAFDIYLRKRTKGTWEVEKCGSSVTREDLPSAPEEIFSE